MSTSTIRSTDRTTNEFRLVVVGEATGLVRTLGSLQNRYHVTVVEQAISIGELRGNGGEERKAALKAKLNDTARYDGLLLAEGSDEQALETLSKFTQSKGIPFWVLTEEVPLQTDNWTAIPSWGNADVIASVLGLESRRGFPYVVIVSSNKGGVGKTELAMSVAISLAQAGKNVVLLDDDKGTNSLRNRFEISQGQHLHTGHLVQSVATGQRLTPALINEHLVPVDAMTHLAEYNLPKKLRVLFGPESSLQTYTMNPDFARDMIFLLGELQADYVVVDSPPDPLGASSFTIEILQMATNREKVLFLIPSPPDRMTGISLKPGMPGPTQLTRDIFKHFNYPLDKMIPVVTCLRENHDPEQVLGSEAIWTNNVPVIPYYPHATARQWGLPIILLEDTAIGKFIDRMLGRAHIGIVRKAYADLAQLVISLSEKTSEKEG